MMWTSWAGSATLEDTSSARLIFQLRPSISVDSLRHITFLGGGGHRTWKYAHMFLLRIQDEADCGKGTQLHWGDTAQKTVYWTLCLKFGPNQASNSWDIAEKIYMVGWVDCWVGGWVGGWFLQEILPLHASILQSKMEPSWAISTHKSEGVI